jgi:hypothetical protein
MPLPVEILNLPESVLSRHPEVVLEPDQEGRGRVYGVIAGRC